MLNTGWLSFNLCVPGTCADTDLAGIVAQSFNPNTSTISCESPPPSAVIPAVVSTVSVLAITVLLILSFKPPKDVTHAKRLEKAKVMMRALKNEAANKEYIDPTDYDGTSGVVN
jgi:hypothetical protein